MREYRVYNKLNCSFFDLLGEKEPDQTKGLGYLLTKSDLALRCLLEIIQFDKTEIDGLLDMNRVVDCELIQRLGEKKSYRADVFIRFYKDYTPYMAIVIEAKSTKAQTSSDKAAWQLSNYSDSFTELEPFKGKTYLVTLTKIVDIDSKDPNVISVTWQQLLTKFGTYRFEKNQDQLLIDYFNYLNKISGTMDYYDVEILSVPAGVTYSLAGDPQCAIYECPIEGKQYEARGKKRPLYMAFRLPQSHGRIEWLYKIQDILSFDLNDKATIESIDSIEENGEQKYPNFKKRIEEYKRRTQINQTKWTCFGKKLVFVIDLENSIELQYPVEYEGSIRGQAGNVYLTLKEVFGPPTSTSNGPIVKIKMKKDK